MKKLKYVFGGVFKSVQPKSPVKRQNLGVVVARCNACPYFKYEDRLVFESERFRHEEADHDVETLSNTAFTETDAYFEGVERDADDEGTLEL